MRLILFFVLVTLNFSSDIVTQSIPKMLLQSGANFSSLSNTGLTTDFLNCGRTDMSVYSIRLSFTATGKVALCPSDASGLCTSAGDTTETSAISLNSGDIVWLGYSPNLKSYVPSEVTTFTKLDGSFVANRWCVREDFLR